jgi:hypothetical protein
MDIGSMYMANAAPTTPDVGTNQMTTDQFKAFRN